MGADKSITQNIAIKIDTEGIDEAIEKMNQLKVLLQEVLILIGSLRN